MAVMINRLYVCSDMEPEIYSIALADVRRSKFEALCNFREELRLTSNPRAYICGVLKGKLMVLLEKTHQFFLVYFTGQMSEIELGIDGVQSGCAAVLNGAIYVADNREPEKKYYIRKFEAEP